MLIKLNNADVVLSGQPVLQGINWQLDKGQHWRVDGPNGAGKTTLLKTMAGLLWPVAKTPPSRLYGFDGKPGHLLAGVRKRIGFASYGMQDEYVRGRRNLNCHEIIASGFDQNIMVYDELSEGQEQAIDEICATLKLELSLLNASFMSVSHGQKSAILFARAIIHQPEILILDEIFNGVDNKKFELMIRVLQRYRQNAGHIILSWHEHGIRAIEELFTHRIQIENGQIKSSLNIIQKDIGTEIPVNQSSRNLSPAQSSKKLIVFKNVNVYLANKPVLKNINWTIRQGEHWLLKGDNGAGKTTLLKTLLAEVRPSVDSEIWRRGFSPRSSVWQIRKLIGYVSPELQQSYQYNISVVEAVATGFFSSIGLYDRVSAHQQTIVDAQIQQFNLQELSDKGVHQISSGQMRRVLIARAMVLDPEILIFDEITANLDRTSRSNILAVISDLIALGKTLILVGHHQQEIAGMYNKVLNIANGEITMADF